MSVLGLILVVVGILALLGLIPLGGSVAWILLIVGIVLIALSRRGSRL